MRWLVAVLSLSCASVPANTAMSAMEDQIFHKFGCRTQCGLYGPQVRDCEAFQKAENNILSAYSRHAYRFAGHDWSRPRLCGALHGWTVYVSPTEFLQDSWQAYEHSRPSLRLYGLTLPPERAVLVATQVWERSALAHELGHALQYTLEAGTNHSGWTPLGLCSAINAAKELPDDCRQPEYQ